AAVNYFYSDIQSPDEFLVGEDGNCGTDWLDELCGSLPSPPVLHDQMMSQTATSTASSSQGQQLSAGEILLTASSSTAASSFSSPSCSNGPDVAATDDGSDSGLDVNLNSPTTWLLMGDYGHEQGREQLAQQQQQQQQHLLLQQQQQQQQQQGMELDWISPLDREEVSRLPPPPHSGNSCSRNWNLKPELGAQLSSNRPGQCLLQLTAEERFTYASEGIPPPTGLPLSAHEEKALKRIRRKLKNKWSAQESRRRKKEYMESLEQRVDQYATENDSLRRRVDQLESSNRGLLAQLRQLQQTCANASATAAAAAAAAASSAVVRTRQHQPQTPLGRVSSRTESSTSSTTSLSAAATSTTTLAAVVLCFALFFTVPPTALLTGGGGGGASVSSQHPELHQHYHYHYHGQRGHINQRSHHQHHQQPQPQLPRATLSLSLDPGLLRPTAPLIWWQRNNETPGAGYYSSYDYYYYYYYYYSRLGGFGPAAAAPDIDPNLHPAGPEVPDEAAAWRTWRRRRPGRVFPAGTAYGPSLLSCQGPIPRRGMTPWSLVAACCWRRLVPDG
ncbi:hypothetical protein BOX15_Mlig016135g1, partial [Macrostomum lignano]